MAKKYYSIPKSATLFYIGLTGVFVYFLTIYFLKKFTIDAFYGAIISMCTVSLSMIILKKFHLQKEHRYSSGINFSKPHKIDFRQVLIKLIGLYGTIGVAAFFIGYFRNTTQIFIIIIPGW